MRTYAELESWRAPVVCLDQNNWGTPFRLGRQMGVACETGSTGVRWPSASLVMCGQSRQDGREPMVSLRISCENYTATRAQEGALEK